MSDVTVSREHERGRAAEYLVAADLILQGVPAITVHGALPYDIIAEFQGERLRVQVKSTDRQRSWAHAANVYRFSLRHGKGSVRPMLASQVDVLAFVALDKRQIAYLHISELHTSDGHIKQCFDLRDSDLYQGRTYPGGKRRVLGWHRMFQGHERFERAANLGGIKYAYGVTT